MTREISDPATPAVQAERIALFTAVRNVPYGTDGAHTADDLFRTNRGDCLAKADALARGFTRLGYQVRRVRWPYLLPPQPPEVALLPSRRDVHTATEVLLHGSWALVDATHDPALSALGLTVSEWDGQGSTAPAYPPTGPTWRAGSDSEKPMVDALPSPEARLRYRTAFNRWLATAQAAPA
ncbi:hypothetical protein ACFWR6_06625 [Streptomyces griseus]|uniref:hypothetical protein n=1 Tax=Streptomyces griseus TaxID=1911 RepID=UPI0036682439